MPRALSNLEKQAATLCHKKHKKRRHLSRIAECAREGGRGGGGERERPLLGTVPNGGSRVSAVHGLRITTLVLQIYVHGKDYPRALMRGWSDGTVEPLRYRQETLGLAA